MKYVYGVFGIFLAMKGVVGNSEFEMLLGSIFVSTYHILNKLDKERD